MLTGKIVKEVEIPGEPGEWMRLRMLPGKKLQQSRDEHSRRQMEVFKAMGADGIAAIQKLDVKKAAESLLADPLAEHDVDVLLRAGIVAWSYDGKVTSQDIEDLDEDTRMWAAREILAMATFTKEDEGNCSSDSTNS